MELTDITQEIYRVSKLLDALPKKIFEAAREFSKAESEYRMELSKELFRLKQEGNMPVTLIPDIARGNLTQLKYMRDLKEAEWKAAIESSKVYQSQMSGLQSILRVQEDI